VRAVLLGAGAVGSRVARQLLTDAGDVESLTILDVDERRAAAVANAIGEPATVGTTVDDALAGADVVVLALPRDHREAAERALEAGASVVSVADSLAEVERLLALDAEARERGRTVVVGAGFSPGLTCVLARHAASGFDSVEEIHVAKVGTAGPACARQHHEALGDVGVDWRDRAWVRRQGGSGRELCWFPDPIRAVDCYRAALPEALLLVPAFPSASRVTARMGATRRDRMTARLPMMRRPHPEGVAGAVRVEVRGMRGRVSDTTVLGAIDRPGVAAGAVAGLAALWVGAGRLEPGAAGLAALVEPVPFLAELARRGVKAAAFVGTAAS
jgi:hypothetical protein